MEMKDIIKALVIAVLTAIVGLIFKYIDPPTIITEVWQRVFVGPWFIWLGAAGFGVYWFARFIHKLHKQTADAIPKVMTANAEVTSQTKQLVETESKSRVSAINSLSDRISKLETSIQIKLDRGLATVHAELSKETAIREGTSAEISNLFLLDSERMNKLETSVPQQFLLRIKEIEAKLTTQISALNKRVEKVEPPLGLNSETYADVIKPPYRETGIINSTLRAPTTPAEGRPGLLSLANSITPSPTNQEIMAQALLDHKNKNKKAT